MARIGKNKKERDTVLYNQDLSAVQSMDHRQKAQSQLQQSPRPAKSPCELPMANVAFFIMTRSHHIVNEKPAPRVKAPQTVSPAPKK